MVFGTGAKTIKLGSTDTESLLQINYAIEAKTNELI